MLGKALATNSLGFWGGLVVKNLLAYAGDVGSIPGSGRSPGEGSGSLLQYSCLGNPMDRGTWWAVARGVAKSQTPLGTYSPATYSWPLILFAAQTFVFTCTHQTVRCISPMLDISHAPQTRMSWIRSKLALQTLPPPPAALFSIQMNGDTVLLWAT